MTDRTEGEMEALSDDRLVMFEMWCGEHHDRQPAYVTRRQKTGLALLAELRRLRAVVEERRWIPVTERLPDADPHSAIVLACSDRGTVRGAYMIWGKTWVWDEFDSAAEHGPNIVAWMPLPKPFAAPNPTTEAE